MKFFWNWRVREAHAGLFSYRLDEVATWGPRVLTELTSLSRVIRLTSDETADPQTDTLRRSPISTVMKLFAELISDQN